jgi:release factor glutamine methyltransferase
MYMLNQPLNPLLRIDWGCSQRRSRSLGMLPDLMQSLSKQELRWMIQAIIDRRRCGRIRTDVDLKSGIETFTIKEKNRLNAWISDRVLKHKPLQYILRSQPFCGLDIKVRPPTLIPRWETEELTLKVIDMIKEHSPKEIRVLDLCSGSGCISLAVAHHLSMISKLEVIGIDNSAAAIALARINQRKLSISNERLKFIQADVFKELPLTGSFDLIISNPPYINYDESKKIDSDVLDWEDHSALFAKDGGLSFYKRIFDLAPQLLNRNSFSSIVLEIDGDSQAQAIMNMTKNKFVFEIWKDLAEKTRSIHCKFKSEIE